MTRAAPEPDWPARFAEEAARIRTALGLPEATIEHIGSTAVPGLPARPVVDLMLVLDGDLPASDVRALRRLGYDRVRSRRSGRVYLRKGTPRSHCLHVVRAAGDERWAALAFRDQLRRDPAVAGRYAAVKSAAAGGPGGYSAAKARFIRAALAGRDTTRAAPRDGS